VLIDSHHKRWSIATVGFAVAALAVYEGFRRMAPAGLTGGSQAGLMYGLLGSLLMIYAGLLAAHRKFPAWKWIGQRKVWLRGHIWLGLLSAVLILCHSGYRWGGPFEKALWFVFILTLVTGIFGLALQHFLPRLITEQIACETPYDQIPHVCQVMRREADEIVSKVCQSVEAPVSAGKSEQADVARDIFVLHMRDAYESEIRPFLMAKSRAASLLFHPLQAEDLFSGLRKRADSPEREQAIVRLETFCNERRQLAMQERLHRWLHGWLYVHIPLSVALLVMGSAHAFMSLYY
jgi:hypothetical protein